MVGRGGMLIMKAPKVINHDDIKTVYDNMREEDKMRIK